MIKIPAKEVVDMQADHLNTDFSVSDLNPNIEEAYFDRQGVIDFLNTLQTQYVKVALASIGTELLSKDFVIKDLDLTKKPITMVMVGVSAQGVVQNGSEGLVSDMPCPPICREKTLKPKIIIST